MTTATPASAKPLAFCSVLTYATDAAVAGTRISREDFVGGDRGLQQIDEEVLGADRAPAARTDDLDLRVERENRRRVVGRRIGVHEAAADRALVAHLHVADVRRRLGQQRALARAAADDSIVVMRRHRADGDAGRRPRECR